MMNANVVMPPIVTLPNGPFADGSSPIYQGRIADSLRVGIPASSLALFVLSIVDTVTGAIINNADAVSVLNEGRGTIDSSGDFTINLETGDTSMDEVPGAAAVQRSLVLRWETTDTPPIVGRHQANFVVVRLAAPP